MKWQRAGFKDGQVWAAVDDAGKPVVQGGRVPIRYSDKPGAKVYNAGASGVQILTGTPAVELDDGETAAPRAAKAARGSGFGSAGTRTAQQAALARDAARDLLGGLGPEVVRAFTDGSCKGNPGPAGAGALVVLPDGRRGERSRALGRATNNVGELVAIGLALDLLEEAGVPNDTPVALFSDSSYANGVLTRGWKAKANTELIVALKQQLARWPRVKLHWVAGHVGIAENERADALANRGVDGITRTTWIPSEQG